MTEQDRSAKIPTLVTVVMRSASPTKASLLGLAAGSLLSAGLCWNAPEASAKWVKVTVRANMDGGSELHDVDGNNIANPIYYSFQLYDYTGTNSVVTSNAQWSQSAGTSSYYPLFGFGTFTDTEGFVGNHYNARNTLYGVNDIVRFGNRTTSNPTMLFQTGRASESGYSIYSTTVTGELREFNAIQISGAIAGFNASNLNTNVTSFIAAALGSSTSATYDCAGAGFAACSGSVTSAEDTLSLTWDEISFEMVEATPSPVPMLGGMAAFGWARKLRRRTSLGFKMNNQQA